MENKKEFSLDSLIVNFNKAAQKIVSNYLENFSGYHHDNRDITLTYMNFFTKMAVNPYEIFKIRNLYLDFFQNQQKLLAGMINANSGDDHAAIQEKDKRFQAKEWTEHPYFYFISRNYLLMEKLTRQIIDTVEINEKTKKKLGFYNEQFMDLLSPANFLFTNPEAMKLAIETKGKSLWDGFNNFISDVEKGKITQSDESAFEVGKNLAITPGSVIYENELMQLLQYSPSTKNVYEVPLLIVPPWINKYYVLDLKPENSFVKFLVDQGITVYIISWRNPFPGMQNITFDDYVKEGALKAVSVACNISAKKKINVLGYCLGGTLLSVALSILSADKKNNPVNTATFLATMIDFSDIGPMGDVIDEALVRKLERGELLKDGVMHGYDMERAFNLIRPNDLVWKYAVNNYLKGISPPPFDVLYWTNDNTNLPAEMYKYYIREMIFENQLSRKNALTICNTPIDVGRIDVPVFAVGFTEDYISPAKTGFITTKLVSGPVEYILGESGHVMGAINPPQKKKYGCYLGGKPGGSFEEWKATAKYYRNSWWIPWSGRLIENSGKQIAAKEKEGNESYKIIEPAPGRYVKEKCHSCFRNGNSRRQLNNTHLNSQELYEKEPELHF